MSNMGYCRFQNTVGDMEDCVDHLDDDLSEDEQEARREFISICVRVASDYGELDES
jgi:hypothetical protein